jgi:hypothetical protein
MTPPTASDDLSLPLWSPEPVSNSAVEVVANAPLHAPASGMSSVREIDTFAGVPVPGPPDEVPSAQACVEPAVEDVGVTDESLAALLAEADSLDEVEELRMTARSPVVALTAIEPPAIDAADVDSPTLELAGGEAAALDAGESVLAPDEVVELAAVDVTFETEPLVFETATVERAVLEPATVDVPEPEIASEAQPPVVTEAALAAVVPDATESSDVVADEAEPAVVAASPLPPSDVVEDVMEEVTAPAAEVLAFVRPEPQPEVVEPVGEPAAVEVSLKKGEATIVALDRLLARVHARRRQLMTESVA